MNSVIVFNVVSDFIYNMSYLVLPKTGRKISSTVSDPLYVKHISGPRSGSFLMIGLVKLLGKTLLNCWEAETKM